MKLFIPESCRAFQKENKDMSASIYRAPALHQAQSCGRMRSSELDTVAARGEVPVEEGSRTPIMQLGQRPSPPYRWRLDTTKMIIVKDR